MISNARYWFLIALVALVYFAGMFVTLFENDSAQFAVMAMRMVQENDFINLFKGPNDYLDKPHMHYWLAAISFKVFGIYDWAYRIPGILALFLGAFSCFKLGKLLYGKDTGRLAALIFLTCQTIVLSAIDVRTDAVLTGFTIFSIWQLAKYVKYGNLKSIAFGAFGAGLAFCTKGQIALVVIGLSILCHLAYTRNWKRLLNWRILLAIMIFGLTTLPMFYALYLQFDIHPEKIIRGRANRSGILFILWEQSFERLSGEGVGKNSSDYFFFFHTFLWVFLPWTVIAIFAYWLRLKSFIKMRFKYRNGFEFLTLGGITLIFLLISFAQFKLPHYMNIMMPLYSILTASYLYRLYTHAKKKELKALLVVQNFLLGIVFIFSVLVCFYVFKFYRWYAYVLLIGLLISIVYFVLKTEAAYLRVITLSVCSSLLLNTVMNIQFYPDLLVYQAGSTMAKKVKENNIPVDKIYKVMGDHTWGLDFYNRKPVKISSMAELSQMRDVWVYVKENELKKFSDAGFDWDKQLEVDQFRITRLNLKFLNPDTRGRQLSQRYLIHLK
ncbi:ArnT family glycosyltransferase [Croceivirga thetidis]|uniref:Glycosyltransferase family 39 protein n=1 Tax=Croceivirga thetidis TaxID=2721623 RepID=A0ABX1GTF3_9FLAO|nr:glycosyltransferase family 39 protein [Croceivirga thetidis]NKI32894.1 glycosyltransferase family 39 protein [Croceivirga thetidis]